MGGIIKLALLISTIVLLLSSCSAFKVRKHGASRDMKIDEIATKEETTTTSPNIYDEKKNSNSSSSSLMSLLISEKWMTPRFTHPLTDAFNNIGLPATVLAGVGLVVLLPIFLVAAGSSWLPLQKVSNLPVQDEPDYSNYFYKAPSSPAPSETYWASESAAPSPSHTTHTIMYSYPPAPAPSIKHHYGYPPSPAPSTNYGYPAVDPSSPAPSMQHYYSPPAPAPSMHYGFPEAPAPSIHYGHSSDPMMSVNYAYQPAAKSSPPPPPPNSYVIDSSNNNGKVVVVAKEDSAKATSRKERSAVVPINYVSDDECVQRLACELTKVAKGWRLPSWMNTVTNVLPSSWQDNNLVQESRKLLSSSDCSHFQCDSYEIVKSSF